MLSTQQFRIHRFVPFPPKFTRRRASTRPRPPIPLKSKAQLTSVLAPEIPIAIPCSVREGDLRGERLLLPAGLRGEALPNHVAVIMDGNGRWAASRGMPAAAGHEAGYRSLQEIVKLSCKWGIRVLTVFAFSAENWLRPKPEVDFLMVLFENALKHNFRDLLREGIRVRIIGNFSKLPKSLQIMAAKLKEITRRNLRLDLVVAISYGGRADIVQACQKVAQKVKNGILLPDDITESVVAKELETSCAAYPDLLIRTSGELRLSNFLLWELAYTELYFAESHWPDFGEDDYAQALLAYQKRQRRFGLRKNYC